MMSADASCTNSFKLIFVKASSSGGNEFPPYLGKGAVESSYVTIIAS